MGKVNDVATKDLSNELSMREGVNTTVLQPYQEMQLTTADGKVIEVISGPAIIHINQD